MSSFQPVADGDVIMPMLGKLRAAFTIASPLMLSGKSEAALKVYVRIALELLSKEKRQFFNPANVCSLEETVNDKQEFINAKEQAWAVRKDLEEIYDGVIDEYCGLSNVTFDPIHKKISRCVEVCMPLVRSGQYTESNKIYRKVAYDVLSNSRSISDKAADLLKFAISCSLTNDNKESNEQLRKGLDYLYEEIRLPDIYCEPVDINSRPANSQGVRVLLLGGAGFDKMPKYDFMTFTDSLIGGISEVEFIEWKEGSSFATFKGKISQANGGGFAGIRCLPKDQSTFKEIIHGCKGILLFIKNAGPKTERFKLVLASEKRARAFNWQSDFLLPPKNEISQIYLPFHYFWPSMFGHVLANNGNVDLDKVDSIGLKLSKLTDNGKPSPEYSDGKFCVEIECIYAIKNDI